MKATFPGKPTYDLKIFSGILTIFKFICSRLNTLHNSNRVHFRQAFIFNLQHTLLTHTKLLPLEECTGAVTKKCSECCSLHLSTCDVTGKHNS